MALPQLRIGALTSALPIVQGGMGVGISMSRLASAVANAGGIGVIAAAMAGIDEPDIATNGAEANIRRLRQEIRLARQKSDGVIGVNIMVALTNFDDMVDTSIAEGVDVIFAGAGLPLTLPGHLVPGTRTKLVPIVSSARAARLIAAKWLSRFAYLPDAFVVEGPRAGGHIGFKKDQIDDPDYALEALVTEVLAVTRELEAKHGRAIPVIAAGGIFDGADIHRFLQLGAAAVQMGTRFVATHECDADEAFKQVYIEARPEDMMVIESPVGLPGRAVRNAFLEAVGEGRRKPFACPYHCIKTCDQRESPYCIAVALANARKGRFKHGFAFAGQNAHRITEIISVRELIDTLKGEYEQAQAVLGGEAVATDGPGVETLAAVG